MSEGIRIVPYRDRGWVLEGTTQVISPNQLPREILLSPETTFTVIYREEEYTFPKQSILRFLDNSEEYLPYPKYLILEALSGYIEVGTSVPLQVNVRFTNGTSKTTFENIALRSSDPETMEVTSTESGYSIVPLKSGEVLLYVSYLDELVISKSFIVLNLNEKLFPQLNYSGQFPNGIN